MEKINIVPKWVNPSEQMSRIGNHSWSVTRLHGLVKDLPIMEIPLIHLNVYTSYENLTLREMAMHVRALVKADMDYPIILDEDGIIMDGRHRIMKALITGAKTIKAVRFTENPAPCKYQND